MFPRVPTALEQSGSIVGNQRPQAEIVWEHSGKTAGTFSIQIQGPTRQGGKIPGED
jgi:hypothetical protein